MFSRPKVVVTGRGSPKRCPFTNLENVKVEEDDIQEIRGLESFDWNRKLNLKKAEKSRSKKKFLVDVADDKHNNENHSPNVRARRDAFGKKRSSGAPTLTSHRAESKEIHNSTDEEISISYEDSSPRYESKDSQHENLLRMAHKHSPGQDNSPSNSVKGPPAELVSPLSLASRRGSFQQLVGSPCLDVAKREVELSPKTPESSTVSPSQQETPPFADDTSDSKTVYTSKEDKSDMSNYDYYNDAYAGQYKHDQNYIDEQDEHYYEQSDYDFQIVNQEFYSDSAYDIHEENQVEEVYSNCPGLKALTPVKLKASVTVETEHVSEEKSMINSPDSSSSRVTSLSSSMETEQLFSKVRHNRIEDVKAQLESGADVRRKDSNGNSLLHICAQNNLKRMASLILEHGADINAENKKGLTALDYCDNYHFDKLGDWFVQQGGDNGILNITP